MLVKETVIMMTSAKENTRAEITTVRMGTPGWTVVYKFRVASDTSFKEGYFFGDFSILPDTSFLLWS